MLFCAGVPCGHVVQRGPRGRRLLFQKWRYCRIFQRVHTRETIDSGVKSMKSCFRFAVPIAIRTDPKQIRSSTNLQWHMGTTSPHNLFRLLQYETNRESGELRNSQLNVTFYIVETSFFTSMTELIALQWRQSRHGRKSGTSQRQ